MQNNKANTSPTLRAFGFAWLRLFMCAGVVWSRPFLCWFAKKPYLCTVKKQMLIMYPFEMENISVGDKRAYLKANGWLPVWNDDNWEDSEILKKSSNPDWCGMPVNKAYQVCKWHVFRRELLRVMRLPLVSFATDFDEHNNCVYKMVWNEGEKTYSIDTLFNGFCFFATLSFETHSSSFEGLTTKRLSIPAAHGFPRKIENIIQFVELFRKSIRKYEP